MIGLSGVVSGEKMSRVEEIRKKWEKKCRWNEPLKHHHINNFKTVVLDEPLTTILPDEMYVLSEIDRLTTRLKESEKVIEDIETLIDLEVKKGEGLTVMERGLQIDIADYRRKYNGK